MSMIQNRYPGKCSTCRQSVASQTGFVRNEAGRGWVTYCREHAPEQITAPVARPVVKRVLTAVGEVRTPYEPQNVPLIKSMPGARWDPDRKVWSVSMAEQDRPRLLELADRLGLEVDPAVRQVSVVETVALPEHLYGFQKTGVTWLARRECALLADDMGLGKTIQTLHALPVDARVIVVCPASLKYNWADEANRWRPDLSVAIGAGRDGMRAPGLGEILVINYDILPEWLLKSPEDRTPEEREQANELAGVILVCDEAHAVKNYKAKRSQKITALCGLVERVWFLTGTPLMNRPGDLYGILAAGGMARQVFGSWTRFLKLFGAVKDRWGGISWGAPDPIVPELLRRVMLRRVRTEVLPDLPTKTYQDITVNGLSTGLRKQLDAAWEEQGDYLTVTEGLPDFEEFSALRAALAQAKIPAMLELVESFEEQGVPLVVASAHRAPVEALGQRAGWATIMGGMAPEARQQVVRDFQAGKLKGVALTIAAGGVGLTLTQAHTMLFVDLDWTPALNAQCEDRICRIGQMANKCQIIRLMADHPLEKHIHKLIAVKVALIQGAVENELKAKQYQLASTLNSNDGPFESAAQYQERMERIARELEARERERQARAQQTPEEQQVARARERVGVILERERAKAGQALPVPSAAQAEQIQGAVRYLAGVCDGAIMRDGQGFNKADTGLGHVLALAGLDQPDALQAAWYIVRRYRRQVGEKFPLVFSR